LWRGKRLGYSNVGIAFRGIVLKFANKAMRSSGRVSILVGEKDEPYPCGEKLKVLNLKIGFLRRPRVRAGRSCKESGRTSCVEAAIDLLFFRYA